MVVDISNMQFCKSNLMVRMHKKKKKKKKKKLVQD